MRPVSSWNKGKREEFKDRKPYDYRVRECKENVAVSGRPATKR